jgi:hypothetical protein
MDLDTNRQLLMVQINQAIEDIGAGEVAVACFLSLFVRVLTDPQLMEQKQQFLTGLECAVEARNGFGKGLVTISEMLDGYMSLVDSMVRVHRKFPRLRVAKAQNSLVELIGQFEACLQWAHRREC